MGGDHFILGIGAGRLEEKYKAWGYEFPSGGPRVSELEETLQIIKALWRDEQVTIRGRHYQVIDARCEPKTNPIPLIMIGGLEASHAALDDTSR